MKTILNSLFCWLVGMSVVMAQQYEHRVHFNDLTDAINPVAVIDSIKHENIAGNTIKHIYFNDGSTESFAVSAIDSVTFAEIELPGVCPVSGNVTDIEGNIYPTVAIGNQCWMAENLRTATYHNGDIIPNVLPNAEWQGLTSGAWVQYNHDAANEFPYGKLYNWYAVNDERNVCPTGWHVPTDEDWKVLEIELGMSPEDADEMFWRGDAEGVGSKLKSVGTAYWNIPNTGATNESGFSALPGGFRTDAGSFDQINSNGHWWTATENSESHAWRRNLSTVSEGVERLTNNKRSGRSVRCVKGE